MARHELFASGGSIITAAPHPVLGTDSIAERRGRRQRVVSRFALIFAIISVVCAAFAQFEFAADLWGASEFDWLRIASYGCLLMGLTMGAGTRQTRTGKVAVCLSLLSAALATILFMLLASFYRHNLFVDDNGASVGMAYSVRETTMGLSLLATLVVAILAALSLESIQKAKKRNHAF